MRGGREERGEAIDQFHVRHARCCAAKGVRQQSQLAKLTRPRLHEAVNRVRLFQMLDRARERQIIWVCGPPGAGKTALVASYIEQARAPAIWYQLDNADSDPATFFYYLRLAVAATGA